ncbi:uncharacterized protein RCO7_15172 [Rhynchosporium graminicola]|uniref:Uncharacterized protein n=1 Tax=Rhynchosporium graminicola TaxID=2792576 RepID=A0A1E1LNW2_9HELO|nr:uncharacterized protein RCO7_15172 [Rhynchosporium commune]
MSSMSSNVMSGGKLVILACSVIPPKGALALEEEEEVDKVALVPEVLELSIENVNEAGSENTSLEDFQ